MTLRDTSVRHICVYLVATDEEGTYSKLIGEYTYKDAVNKYGKAEVLRVQDDVGLTRVTILDEGYEGFVVKHDKTDR